MKTAQGAPTISLVSLAIFSIIILMCFHKLYKWLFITKTNMEIVLIRENWHIG